MNKTLLEGRLNNKWITTTESLQKRKTNAPSFRDKETHKIRINNVFP